MIKYRNLWLQVLWFTLTFGIYSIYWFYVTSKEMSKSLGRDDEILLWTVLMFTPICFYPMYKHGELYELFSDKAVDRWVIFMFWIFFPPAAWFVVQRKLNERALAAANKPTGV